ncbi:hypothetical protein ABEF95_006134 [Exophiala dermatitidis]
MADSRGNQVTTSGSLNPRDAASVQDSNYTSQYFVGGRRRAWMNYTSDHGPWNPPSRPVAPNRTITLQRPPTRESQPSEEAGTTPSAVADLDGPQPETHATSADPTLLSIIGNPNSREGQQEHAEESTDVPRNANIQSSATSVPQAGAMTTASVLQAPPQNIQGSAPPKNTSLAKRKRLSDTELTSERRVRPVSSHVGGAMTGPPATSANSSTSYKGAILTALFDTCVATIQQPLLSTDSSRLLMLRDACQLDDRYFLVLNSTYLWWNEDPTRVPGLGKRMYGYEILQTLVPPNNVLSVAVVDLCKVFSQRLPQHLPELRYDAVRDAYRDYLHHLLDSLGTGYDHLRDNSLKAGIPPCPSQMQLALSVASPVLQKLIFCAILRSASADNNWIQLALTLFQEFQSRAPIPDGPDAHDQRRAIILEFGQRYRALHAHYVNLNHQMTFGASQFPQGMYQNQPINFGMGSLLPAQSLLDARIYPGNQAGQFSPTQQLTFSVPAGYQTAPAIAQQVLPSPAIVQEPPRFNSQSPFSPAAMNHQAAPMASQTVSTARPVARQTRPSITARALGTTAARSSNPPHYTPQPPMASQPQPPVHSGAMARQPAAVAPAQPSPSQMNSAGVTHPTSLFPPATYTLPILAQPDPDKRAMHQAHLAAPKYIKVDYPEAKYYQYVEDIRELPQLLRATTDLVRWTVHISPDVWARKAETMSPVGEFMVKQRKIKNGSVQFRMKCIALDDSAEAPMPSLSDFCARPTTWPKCLSISINGDFGVDFRRKALHGVDLPTDVTDLLEFGDNEIVVCTASTPAESKTSYLLAVEIVCVSTLETVRTIPSRIGAEESLASVTKVLKGGDKEQPANGADDDEDDVVIAQSVLSIDLVDPITSVVWVTPVRGRECQHRECFDLEAFLLSRTSRDKKNADVTDPDQWKCPICRKDARPPMLVVDEFLLQVRQQLQQRNQLEEAKAILVNEDGSWDVKLRRGISAVRSKTTATAANIVNGSKAQSPAKVTSKAGSPQEAEFETAAAAGDKAASATPTAGVSATPPPDSIVVLDDDDDEVMN